MREVNEHEHEGQKARNANERTHRRSARLLAGRAELL